MNLKFLNINYEDSWFLNIFPFSLLEYKSFTALENEISPVIDHFFFSVRIKIGMFIVKTAAKIHVY